MRKQNRIRRSSLLQYGFGIERMKELTVCTNCNSLESSHRTFCKKCEAVLPGNTLYDLYRSYHKVCPKCGTILSENVYYCPHCGIKVKEKHTICAI